MDPEKATLFELWGAADKRARELENAVFSQALNALHGRDRAPTEEQWEHAKVARKLAEDLFHKAMEGVRTGAILVRDGGSSVQLREATPGTDSAGEPTTPRDG